MRPFRPFVRFAPLARLTALATLGLLTATAEAATVYRWVDDAGKVHYSDVVPERYRSSAKPLQAPAAEPGPPAATPKPEAPQRARPAVMAASAPAADRSGAGATAAAAPASAASQPLGKPSGKRPARIPDERTDCATWQRLYIESSDCFGPYRTVRGGIKPEAFEVCNVVPEPPPSRCRLRIP